MMKHRMPVWYQHSFCTVGTSRPLSALVGCLLVDWACWALYVFFLFVFFLIKKWQEKQQDNFSDLLQKPTCGPKRRQAGTQVSYQAGRLTGWVQIMWEPIGAELIWRTLSSFDSSKVTEWFLLFSGAICNFLSDILSIRSCFISESGVKKTTTQL